MTGVSECSQQRGSLKDNGYKKNNGINKIAAENSNQPELKQII
ncbi:hypothetical protein [Photorhabdus sp. RW14-46]|nr:hypothetical protein [Photorhabdus sp. RW14-46]